MNCPSCGRENRELAGFCAWCGAEMSSPVDADEESDQAELVEDQTETEVEDTWVSAESNSVVAPDQESAPSAQSEPSDSEAPAFSACEAPQPSPSSAEAANTAPLAQGDILLDRYQIVELIEDSHDHRLYRAQDRRCCAICGSTGNRLEEKYCQSCGADLSSPTLVTIEEHLHLRPLSYEIQFTERERDYFVLQRDAPQETIEPSGAVSLRWGFGTDAGITRDHNEDSVDIRYYARMNGDSLGLFVVADGLGGQDSGEVASALATQALWQSIRASVWEPFLDGAPPSADALELALRRAVKEANQHVYDERTARSSEMSTTLTLVLVVNGLAIIGNVGDSRTYCWNSDGLQRVTHDHSLVQRLLDTGQIKPEEVYTHPQRNVIYQSIGDRPEVRIDVYRHDLAVGDVLLLCSDGLWEMVRDDGIEEVLLSESDPQEASERLVHHANLAGGEDNISVIIVQALA